MSLLKQLLSEYSEDDVSRKLGDDPTRMVYYLTKQGKEHEALLYSRIHSVLDYIMREDEELMRKVSNLYPDIIDFSYYEYYDVYIDGDIPKEVHELLFDYVEKNKSDIVYSTDNDFTTQSLSYIQFLEYPTLFHFSNNAYDIMIQGFKMGMSDPDMLSLTTHHGDEVKSYGGFNFAFNQDSRIVNPTKYGSELVMFTVPKAIECTHYGDQEEQTIFWGSHAEKITYFSVLDAYDERSDFEYSYSTHYDDEGDLRKLEENMKEMVDHLDRLGLKENVLDDLNANLDTNFNEFPISHKQVDSIEMFVDLFYDTINIGGDHIQDAGDMIFAHRMINGKEVKKMLGRTYSGNHIDEYVFKEDIEHLTIEDIDKLFKQQ